MPTVALYAPLGPGDASLILYSSALLVSLCLQSFPASLHRPHHSRATRTSCLGIAPTSASNCVLCDAKRTVAWGSVGRSPQRRARASHCWRAACPPRAGYSQWQPCAARASHAPSHPQAGAVCALTRVASPVPRRSHSIRLTCDLFPGVIQIHTDLDMAGSFPAPRTNGTSWPSLTTNTARFPTHGRSPSPAFPRTVRWLRRCTYTHSPRINTNVS